MGFDERIEVLGRLFTLRAEGPLLSGRYEIRIYEGRRTPWRKPYLRAPIRGRSLEEARERAVEVLHTYAGLDRFRVMVEDVAQRVAPGGGVEIGEDAQEVTVVLTGPYFLEVPLVISRADVLDRRADLEHLRGLVRSHLEAYAKPASTPPR